MRMAVGAVYQTVTFCCCEDAVPALGVELGLVDDHGGAVGQRRDDAVGRAGDPAGIGGAPEDIVRMEIEDEAAGDVMRDHGVVDVHGPFRPAGRAAGEMQQRHVFGSGPHAHRTCRMALARAAARSVVPGGGVGGAIDQQDVLKARQLGAPRLDFAPVKRLGRDQDLRIADGHAGLDRLRPERREQRRENAAIFERAESREVELRNAAE